MEHHKISNSLNDSTVSKLFTKWVEINDLSSGQYSVNKHIRFKISLIRSDLCDYSDAFTVVKGTISITGINDNNKRNKE